MLTRPEITRSSFYAGSFTRDFSWQIRTRCPADWSAVLLRAGFGNLELSEQDQDILSAGWAAYEPYGRRVIAGIAPRFVDPADFMTDADRQYGAWLWCVGWIHHQADLTNRLVALWTVSAHSAEVASKYALFKSER